MGVIVRLRCREVALAGKGRAGRWCRAVRYDSLGLNKRHRAAAPLFGFVMDSVDLGHRRIGAFLTTPHLLRLLALGSLSLDSGSRLAEVFFWISDFPPVDQFLIAIVVSPSACGSFLICRALGFLCFSSNLVFLGWFCHVHGFPQAGADFTPVNSN